MKQIKVLLAPLLVAVSAATAVGDPAKIALPAFGPRLAAASNYGQTWDPKSLDAAQAERILRLRDEIHWDAVDFVGGYTYETFLTRYPALLDARKMSMVLLAGGTHPEFDNDLTPFSPEGIAAFAAFTADAVARFPAIDAVEVGNEANTESFTSGPALGQNITERAQYYSNILRATQAAVRSIRPNMRIIGGAAHSIPLAWFIALSDAGAAGWMDSVAIHPYNTPPEQFRRQVDLLRAIPGFETMPIEVTELGTTDATLAQAHLVKSYCQMALSGVSEMVWYPLTPRGDGFEPLINSESQPTDVAAVFQFLQAELVGLPVTDVSPDPFTYACQFGERILVIWGAERSVTINAPGLSTADLMGRPSDTSRLSPDTPLYIISGGTPITLAENVLLGRQEVIADSYDQFSYPGYDTDGFTRFARAGERIIPLVLGPGQQTGGVPWTPYLHAAEDGGLRMDATFLLPSIDMMSGAPIPAELVHTWQAPQATTIAGELMIAPSHESSDGVLVTTRHNARILSSQIVTSPKVLRLRDVQMAKGDILEIAVGPNGSAKGDASLYRFTLRTAP